MLGSTVALIAAVTVRHDLVDFVFRSGTPRAATTKAAMTPLSPNAALPGSTTSNARKINDPKLTFDVVRIDRDASVFAGRAPPNSDVTITANGRAVASATADETGAWATVTEQEIAPGEYEFSLRAKSEHSAVTTGQTVRMAVAPTSSIITASPTRQATSRQLIPAPITFLYNETIFTKEGRQAATLLAKHLTSQQYAGVALSGHADERGSDLYNMELSRQRLLVVSEFLRKNGFVGELELIPKGKSEPYVGIDRHELSTEDAFQLDRRVELRQVR